MSGLRFGRSWLFLAIIFLVSFSGCGGSKPPGPSPFAARVNLIPSPTASMQLGSIVIFTASAQNASGSNVRASFAFTSSDTSILNIAPNGSACAGHWDAFYVNCTPGGTGVVQVTAAATNASSASTLVYVHPVIDNIVVQGISLTGLPVQEPCLAQSQTMTVQAYAYSQGTDVTSSVGPFTWSANNASVVKLTPLMTQVVYQNFTYNVATNQATAAAVNPGITQIYASADGVSSTSFLQPNGPGAPPLDFFATCPIQSITLEVGQAGSGQTSFVASKGSSSSSETVVATVTDLAGNSSLPNTDGAIVLSKIPLTWTSSQPQIMSIPSNCTLSCTLSLPSTGAATVSASCSPPTCNIGFPFVPPSLSTPTLVQNCTNFFASLFPNNKNFSCQALIPVPVYPFPLQPPPAPQVGAISGLVTGPTASATVLAGSVGCAQVQPATCATAMYSVTTTKAQAGNPALPFAPPNSLMFDLGGDKAYVGSDFGAMTVTPGNIGGTSSAFAPLGTVSGQVLAVSPKGDMAVFSDTIQTPNQVYITNTSGQTATFTALNISNASTAAFSPDELRAFISGFDSSGNPNLYIYSPLQALQAIPLAPQTAVNKIALSNNGAFTYVAESSGGATNLVAYDNCNISSVNNQVAATVSLPAAPFIMRVLPATQITGTDTQGIPIPNGEHIFMLDATGIDVVTAQLPAIPPGAPGCPQTISFANSAAQRIELNQGTIDPMTFFVSPDGTQIYLLASDRSSIYLYDFNASAWTGGILLNGTDVTPVAADVSLDTGLIMIAGSDGLLHTVTTGLNGFDGTPLQIPNLTDYLNPFCNFTPPGGACTFNLLAAK